MTKSQPTVAYLCMEFAVSNDIKTYAGGLGILAGDYLKGASEENLPIIGVGIKWKQGYTSQKLDENGKVVDTYKNYPYRDFEDTGVKVCVEVRNRPVHCKVWKATGHGVSELYLLDTDIPENADTWITGQLYGWFGEERVAQEMVLGIGGVRALQALGREPDVYHFNEGHAVLAGLELIRQKREAGASLEEAVSELKQKMVFTTHTPVPEGNESHRLELLEYLGANAGFSREEMEQIGGNPFNMTVAALNLSRATNAVAQLHAKTAQKMWAHVKLEKPIIGITNGIHRGTWVDDKIQEFKADRKALWNRHMELKRQLISFVKDRSGVELKEDKLLIGFSRRAAPYKRSNLIFRSGEQVLEALRSGNLQIVFSGKAHPLDDVGKGIVEEIARYSKELSHSVVFLEDYDMDIGAMLTRGSDIWLNNPRRPLEACGTSGMKAAMNGVPNLSTLDGWWPEACEHGVNGWAIGSEKEYDNKDEHDEQDAIALGQVLTNEVMPLYYDNQDAWIDMMQASINSVTKRYSVETMLADYYERLYT